MLLWRTFSVIVEQILSCIHIGLTVDPSFETILRIKQKIVSKEKWAISGNSLTWNCEGKGFMGGGGGMGGGGAGIQES